MRETFEGGESVYVILSQPLDPHLVAVLRSYHRRTAHEAKGRPVRAKPDKLKKKDEISRINLLRSGLLSLSIDRIELMEKGKESALAWYV